MDKIINCYKNGISYFDKNNKKIIVHSKDISKQLIQDLKKDGYKIKSDLKSEVK